MSNIQWKCFHRIRQFKAEIKNFKINCKVNWSYASIHFPRKWYCISFEFFYINYHTFAICFMTVYEYSRVVVQGVIRLKKRRKKSINFGLL